VSVSRGHAEIESDAAGQRDAEKNDPDRPLRPFLVRRWNVQLFEFVGFMQLRGVDHSTRRS